MRSATEPPSSLVDRRVRDAATRLPYEDVQREPRGASRLAFQAFSFLCGGMERGRDVEAPARKAANTKVNGHAAWPCLAKVPCGGGKDGGDEKGSCAVCGVGYESLIIAARGLQSVTAVLGRTLRILPLGWLPPPGRSRINPRGEGFEISRTPRDETRATTNQADAAESEPSSSAAIMENGKFPGLHGALPCVLALWAISSSPGSLRGSRPPHRVDPILPEERRPLPSPEPSSTSTHRAQTLLWLWALGDTDKKRDLTSEIRPIYPPITH
ncbi:hypothetical protein CSOJ01_12330 [Colletotrichum sojae]|uniref:Uncharacterized protein n=1 Tax=Colletotrichum sojae TaxID=2175907 RepID=A0A8H6MLR7_9PEZI|nr:hypothetical protein CSOJ01_12330 [Colletotrichum sojae]